MDDLARALMLFGPPLPGPYDVADPNPSQFPQLGQVPPNPGLAVTPWPFGLTIVPSGPGGPVIGGGEGVRLPVILNDGRTVEDPNTRETLLLPPDVSMPQVVETGQLLSQLPPLMKDAAMWYLFNQGGPMDFQRQPDGKFNAEYRNISNYLFGVVMAAAGYSPKDALFTAGWVNQRSTNPDKSAAFGGNPLNAYYISQGYQNHLFGFHDRPAQQPPSQADGRTGP
jgi:hypothetical protein